MAATFPGAMGYPVQPVGYIIKKHKKQKRMMQVKETIYTRDEAKKMLKVERDFDAPLSRVWQAWTESELLDQWWAPKPYKAVTQSQDFKEGGRWRYYMQGPNDEKHYCKVDYTAIEKEKTFSGVDAFCNEKGETLSEMPSMNWKVLFTPIGDATKVHVEVTFKSLDDMNKIVEMGFQEGFAAAHNNLDEIL